MRGAVSAGMCLVLEAAGLMASFDRVYGCSSGALTGCFAAAGQASVWATSFEDCATPRVHRPAPRAARPARARPRLPLRSCDRAGAARCPRPGGPRAPSSARSPCRRRARSCACCATSSSAADALAAVRASCSIPVLTGAPPDLPRRADGRRRPARVDPVPHRAARGSDARARPALALRRRSRHPRGPAGRADARPHPSRAGAAAAQLRRALQPRHRGARSAWTGDRRCSRSCARSPSRPGSRLVPRLSTDRTRIADSIRLGAVTMASALYGAPRDAVLAALPRAARGLASSRAGGRGGPTWARRPRPRGSPRARPRAGPGSPPPRRAGRSRTRPRSGAPGRARRAARRCRARA